MAWKNSGVEVNYDTDVNSIYFWLNEKNIETRIVHSNLPLVTNKYDPEYKKCRFELVDEPKYQPFRRFIRNDLTKKLVKSNLRSDEIVAFRKKLGLNGTDTKEETVLEAVKDAFEGENMQIQHNVLGYRIDLYFHDYRLTIEVDEYGHNNRNIDYEIQRQKGIEKELRCEFISINPDEQDFNIFNTIIKIHRHIKKLAKESPEKSSKNSLVDKISKILLELEFKSNHSTKSNLLKRIVK